jgi:hypothetical protein
MALKDSEKAHRAARDNEFRRRVAAVVTRVASTVPGEGGVAGHAERLVYAAKLLAGPTEAGGDPFHAWPLAVASQANVLALLDANGGTDGVTDGALNTAIGDLFNAFSGADI